MNIRKLATTIATAFVAICVAFAVPVSQLRVRTVITKCCCPDPTKCHCPDHKGAPDDGATMRACHKSQHELASATVSSFAPPTIASTDLPSRPAMVMTTFIAASPKTPPVPEPAGPS